MALTYSTGTVSVTAGGTSVVGSGTIWTGGNVSIDDDFVIDGVPAKVTDIVDATHLTITTWIGSTKSGASYVVRQNSSRRFDDVQIADDLRAQVASLNKAGYYHFVDPSFSVPDPSLGENLQIGVQLSTGKWWQKQSGVWVSIASPYGMEGAQALAEIVAAGKQADARTNLGATSVGNALFTATDAAAVRTALAAAGTAASNIFSGNNTFSEFIYAAKGLQQSGLPSAGPALSASTNFTVAQGAGGDVGSSVAALFLIMNVSAGTAAIYIGVGGVAMTLLGQAGATFDNGELNPAAGKLSVGWNGTYSRWFVVNNTGASSTCRALVIALA